MPNPFPGVDPYIEQTEYWVGFHNMLISQCCILLNSVLLSRGYAAVVEKRLDLVNRTLDDDAYRVGDIGVEPTADYLGGAGATAITVSAEASILTLPELQTVPVAYLDIRSLSRRQTVSTIEVLSPTNKTSGRAAYAEKRMQLLSTDVNLVEIDLLLCGRRPRLIGKLPAGDFFACVSRGDRRPCCEVYGWSIRRPLPRLPIPLRPGEDDAVLDLAAAYKMTYDGGAYHALMDYTAELAGLSDADRQWAVECLKAAAA